MNELYKKKTNKTIGKNIRTFRHQHGWSQDDVARRLGISIPALSKIETGVTDINLSRLEQIANIYEISVAQLFSIDFEEVEIEHSSRGTIQKNVVDQEDEISSLQRKIILLYEELRSKSQ